MVMMMMMMMTMTMMRRESRRGVVEVLCKDNDDYDDVDNLTVLGFFCDSVNLTHCATTNSWGDLELYIELPLTFTSILSICVSYSLILLVLRQQQKKMAEHKQQPKAKLNQVAPLQPKVRDGPDGARDQPRSYAKARPCTCRFLPPILATCGANHEKQEMLRSQRIHEALFRKPVGKLPQTTSDLLAGESKPEARTISSTSEMCNASHMSDSVGETESARKTQRVSTQTLELSLDQERFSKPGKARGVARSEVSQETREIEIISSSYQSSCFTSQAVGSFSSVSNVVGSVLELPSVVDSLAVDKDTNQANMQNAAITVEEFNEGSQMSVSSPETTIAKLSSCIDTDVGNRKVITSCAFPSHGSTSNDQSCLNKISGENLKNGTQCSNSNITSQLNVKKLTPDGDKSKIYVLISTGVTTHSTSVGCLDGSSNIIGNTRSCAGLSTRSPSYRVWPFSQFASTNTSEEMGQHSTMESSNSVEISGYKEMHPKSVTNSSHPPVEFENREFSFSVNSNPGESPNHPPLVSCANTILHEKFVDVLNDTSVKQIANSNCRLLDRDIQSANAPEDDTICGDSFTSPPCSGDLTSNFVVVDNSEKESNDNVQKAEVSKSHHAASYQNKTDLTTFSTEHSGTKTSESHPDSHQKHSESVYGEESLIVVINSMKSGSEPISNSTPAPVSVHLVEEKCVEIVDSDGTVHPEEEKRVEIVDSDGTVHPVEDKRVEIVDSDGTVHPVEEKLSIHHVEEKRVENVDSDGPVHPVEEKRVEIVDSDGTVHPVEEKRVEIVDSDGTVHLEAVRRLTQENSPSALNIEGAVCLMNPKNKELGRRKVELKAALKVGLLFLSFLLLWTPLPLVVTVIRVTSSVPRKSVQADLVGVFSALASSTAALDPILYGLLNRPIRIAMKQMLKKVRRKLSQSVCAQKVAAFSRTA
ncbi:hypothetical protein ElyMa_005976600 [Elysia marginata]|uniref:G-protein coupled receptors family 1 profile domain-containing protein n=1 Tax=Elysia marginata TaxID=1093978 RepID=A0AAV4GDX9_9GAST|nr:hypothetical protein ElyMa_005976600 [Elysia marginata]